jgi:phosphatidylglycerol:prolipoprotein diacylglycerol transferase
MRRILWHGHGLTLYSYPTLLYLGLVVGIIAGNAAAHAAHLDAARVFIATLLLLVPALSGARLLFVAAHWEVYRRQPQRIWRRSEGGAALYGGLPLMLLCSVPLLALLHLPFGAFWDVATFTILVGMICTRAGCLLNGCCAGRVTNGWLALPLPDVSGHTQRRIPTQLLEMGWAALLLLGALMLWPRLPFAGALFLYLMAGYGLGRLLIEPTRAEHDTVGPRGLLALHSLISLALIAIALGALTLAWTR